VSVNQLLGKLFFALEAIAIRVLAYAYRVKRSFTRRALTSFFICVKDFLTYTDWLELWKKLPSSKLLSEKVEIRWKLYSKCFQ
jgi:hypothetical protein